ncbi:MAG: BatD family protein [candidate division FCPU426 bacterium]
MAGSFELSAAVSKDHVELGETFTLSLTVNEDGNFAFSPQLELPRFDGFQVQSGPQQRQQVTWVNGVGKAKVMVEWELAPLRAGRLNLGPFRALAKDATSGDVVKTAPALTITVSRGVGQALPPTPTPEGEEDLDAEGLRDIKPDLGPPWARILLLAAVLLLLLGLGLWFWLRPRKSRPVEIVRDPAQLALLDLERARTLLDQGDEPGYYRELARVIRFYLRHRSRKPEKELTLLEAEALMRAVLSAQGYAALAPTIERLQLLLFAKVKPEALDAERLPQGLRQGILLMEEKGDWKAFEPALVTTPTRGKKNGKRIKKAKP